MRSLGNILSVICVVAVGLLVLAYEDLRATKSAVEIVPIMVPIPVFAPPVVEETAWPAVTLMPDESWTYSFVVNGVVRQRVHVYNNSFEWLTFNPEDLIFGHECPQSGLFIFGNLPNAIYIGYNGAQIDGDIWQNMLQAWDWQCGNAVYAPLGYSYYQVDG